MLQDTGYAPYNLPLLNNKNTKLQCHPRRFLSTNTILLYTIHPKGVPVQAHVRSIIFIFAHRTIDHYTCQGVAWYCVFIWKRECDQLKICSRYTMNFKFCSQNPRFHHCRNTLNNGTTAEKSICKGFYISSICLQASPGWQRFERGFKVSFFRYFFHLFTLQSLPFNDPTTKEEILQRAWLWH